MTIKKGDKVICIEDGLYNEISSKLIQHKPQEGKEYTVRDVGLTANGKGIWLQEIINPLLPHPSGLGKFEPSFDVNRFIVKE